MTDRVLDDFLQTQLEDGLALAAASDVFDLVPLGTSTDPLGRTPPRRYLARFRCTGLVETDGGAIVEAHEFVAGIWFRDDHLRAIDPGMLVTWLEPRRIFHPNVSAPYVCLGHTGVGISLVELVYQLHAIITYNKATLDDALNGAAAAWAREHLSRFPTDRRPLKRRPGAATAGVTPELDFTIEDLAGARA